MLRRLVKASAIMVGVGLAVAACSPVKMGAAAIVGNERITIATLDTEVTNLSQAAAQYPAAVSLNASQRTQATLTWLIRYQIFEEMARQAGITVSTAQGQQALNQAVAAAEASAEQQGLTNVTRTLILAASGIPPNTSDELGRYEAIASQYLTIANGGTPPAAGSAAQTAAGNKLNTAECQAAKALNISVNPQFGQLDYNGYQVVTAPSPVTRTQGPVKAAVPGRDGARLLIVLATSPRVAPGLLSWPAWEALRSASAVLAPAGHPQLPALDAAGIAYRVVEGASAELADSDEVRVRYSVAARTGHRSAASAGGTADPGSGGSARCALHRPGRDHGPAAGGVPVGCQADPCLARAAPARGVLRGRGGARGRRPAGAPRGAGRRADAARVPRADRG